MVYRRNFKLYDFEVELGFCSLICFIVPAYAYMVWRPSRVYSSSKSSEMVFCVPRGCYPWHGAPFNVQSEGHFQIISPFERSWSFIWTNVNPLYPGMLRAMFGWNWPSGSGEEDKNVKSLQQQPRQTNFDQKSSLEPLAQVS